MEHIYPDMDWNISRSHDKSLATRCPYANMHRCPRYYESYALLGKSGITTALEPEADMALHEKWKNTDLWPALAEQATSISHSDGNKIQFSNFCPEVAFDTFGLFASSLCRYADEIDRENAVNRLLGDGRTFAKDWRWEWASLNPMHYSECPLYSQLVVLQPIAPDCTKEEIVSMKPGAFGFSVDLKKLISGFVGGGFLDTARGKTLRSRGATRQSRATLMTLNVSRDMRLHGIKLASCV